MEVFKFEQIRKSEINKIASALISGKIVVLPTETCYGYSARFDSKLAAKKIAQIKGRERAKRFIILVKNRQMAAKYAIIDTRTNKLIKDRPKKPISLVLRRKNNSKKETLALRVSNYPLIRKLFTKINFPLISSSVNKSGQKPFYRAQDILKNSSLTKGVSMFIDAGNLPKIPPSTVLDLSDKVPRVLRQGAVNKKLLAKILQKYEL